MPDFLSFWQQTTTARSHRFAPISSSIFNFSSFQPVHVSLHSLDLVLSIPRAPHSATPSWRPRSPTPQPIWQWHHCCHRRFHPSPFLSLMFISACIAGARLGWRHLEQRDRGSGGYGHRWWGRYDGDDRRWDARGRRKVWMGCSFFFFSRSGTLKCVTSIIGG